MKTKKQTPSSVSDQQAEPFDAAEYLEDGDDAPESPPGVQPEQLPLPPRQEPRTVEAAITLPLRDVAEGDYCSRHADVQLDAGQAKVLARLYRGLDQAAARLENGRFVRGPADAVRYVLEQLGKADMGRAK